MNTFYENWSVDIFPGFYETFIDPNEVVDTYMNEDLPEGYYWDFIDGGYWKVANELAELWVDEMNMALQSNDVIKSMKFDSIKSPKYYNYSTDKLVLDMDIDKEALEDICFNKESDAFNEYLQSHWSSHDGFASFVPNSLGEFKDEYMGKEQSGLLDILIEFYLLKNINFKDVETTVWENLSSSEMDTMLDNLCLVSEKDHKQYGYEWSNEDEEYKATDEIE